MATFYDWSTTPASNASVGNIDWAEGMAPSQVNNSARQEMADVAAWRDFFGGAKTTSGTDTITLTSGMTITAYASNQLFVAKLGGTNTGAATLNIDSLGAKAVQISGSAVAAGELVSGKFYMFVYDGTAFQASRLSAAAATTYTTATTTTEGVIELATDAEVVTGTDTSRAVTSSGVAAALVSVSSSDRTALDMAASALAYGMQNDATSITGAVGLFWLSDDFESDSLATKTNANYNATGDYYTTEASAVEDGLDGVTASAASILGDGIASRKYGGLQFTASQTGTLTKAGIYTDSENTNLQAADFHFELWTDSSGSPGTQVGSDSETRNMTNTNTHEIFSFSSPPSLSSGTLYWLVLVDESSNGYVYFDRITSSQPAFGSGDADTIAGLTDDGAANNSGNSWKMTVENTASVGNAVIAPTAVTLTTADPTDILAYVIIDPVDAVTVGTDIIMTMSVDGGTTDATGSWTLIGQLGSTGEYLYRVEADVSGQTGSSLTYEITTLNTKEVRLHDVVGLIAIY